MNTITFHLILLLLFGLFMLSVDASIGELFRSGFAAHMRKLLQEDGSRLPDNDDLVLKEYTGVYLIDRFLASLNILASPFTDGSNPALQLVGFHYLGQSVALYLVFVVESHRAGYQQSPIRFATLWALLLQVFTIGNVLPVFCVAHLITTHFQPGPRAAVRVCDPWTLVAVLPALLPGFFFVTALVGAPFANGAARQWITAAYQPYPLYVVFWQLLATRVIRRISTGQYRHAAEAERERDVLRHIYDVAWNLAAFAQLVTYTVVAGARFYPAVFGVEAAAHLTFGRAFVPSRWPHTSAPWGGAVSTVHDYYLYSLGVGYLSAIVWAWTLLRMGTGPQSLRPTRDIIAGVIRTMVLGGPFGTVIALLRERDEEVLEREIMRELEEEKLAV